MHRTLALLAFGLFSAISCASQEGATRRPAAVMGFEGAGWLERASRASEEQPARVLEAMALAEGDTVADLGCGSGYFARRLAHVVGPSGVVYCVDIQPEMLALARQLAERDGVADRMRFVQATDADPKLPAGEVDWALLVDVYHELQQPAPVLEALRSSLAPGGRVALVEYRLEGDSARHIKLEHRMSARQVLAEWEPAGFHLVDQIETLPTQHLFVFESAGP